jgi:hypothetical protein
LGIATGAFISDVIETLKERGYSFITVEEALADPAYLTEEKYVGSDGLSFIDRVAATKGLPFNPNHAQTSRRAIESELGPAIRE